MPRPRCVRWLVRWLLTAGLVLPQTTCTIEGPPGSTFVVDPGVAVIAADLIRDIVFLRNADDDYFEEIAEHGHDHFFDGWWW